MRSNLPIVCRECGWVGYQKDRLVAAHPFNPDWELYGCPACLEADSMVLNDVDTGMIIRDDDGVWVGDGDTISYKYGIPQMTEYAKIKQVDGRLIGTCLSGSNPKTFSLRSLRTYVGSWYKED